MQRNKLELQLQPEDDALFQRRMGKIKQSILPRLQEILRQLLKGSWPIRFENQYDQLACNILCASLLSEGSPDAKQFLQYTGCTPGTSGYGHTTSSIQQFKRWENETEQWKACARN